MKSVAETLFGAAAVGRLFIDLIRHLASNQSPSLPPFTIYPFILLSSSPSICIMTFDPSLLGRKGNRLTSALNAHTHTSIVQRASPQLCKSKCR